MNTAEERRAAAYRAEQLARAQATAGRIASLAGDPVARAALQLAWAPVLMVAGPLVQVSRGMYADRDDLTPDDCPSDMPFTGQIA